MSLPASKVFEGLWVPGVLGTLVVVVIKYPMVHWQNAALVDSVICLKFGYLIWLIVYFFTSAMLNDAPEPSWRSLTIDVLQSVGAVGAATALGILDSSVRLALNWQFFWPNLAMASICLGSLWLSDRRTRTLRMLRSCAFTVAAAASICVAVVRLSECALVIGLAVVLVLMSLILSVYMAVSFPNFVPSKVRTALLDELRKLDSD